jgi:biotin carboxyl carrier protein
LERVREEILAVRFAIEIQDKFYDVQVEQEHAPGRNQLKLSVKNESHRIERQIQLLAQIGSRLILSLDNRVFDLIVDSDEQEFTVNWKSLQYSMVLSEGHSLRKKSKTGSVTAKGIVTAQMPGKIVAVLKEAGDPVARGEGVLVMEAMKMQNEIKAPREGILTSLPVQKNNNVNTGDLLFEIG